MPPRWNYFEQNEVEGLKDEYVAKLDLARGRTIELDSEKKGVAFIITSGLRSSEANKSVIGAVPNSAHLKGLATDLKVETDFQVALIVEALLSVGINRIGIYVNKDWQPIHVHNDADPDKPANVIFIKQEQN